MFITLSKKFFNRQFFQTVLAIAASVLAVVGLVYGATTIGTNISVDGNLTISGNTVSYANFSTTTIPNNLVNAWSIATSTSVTPIFTIDTTNGGRIGIGTQPISGSNSGTGRLTVNGNIMLTPETSSIEFAAASSTKQAGTATIVFNTAGRNALELVGGGPWPGSVIRLWESVVISEGVSAPIGGPGGLHVARSAYFATANPGDGPTNVSNDSVGIGTQSPKGLLDVNGILTVKSTGNVGIGTTSPAQLLSVAGDAYIAGTGTTTLSLKTTTASKGTCLEMFDSGGAVRRLYINAAGAITVEAGTCK